MKWLFVAAAIAYPLLVFAGLHWFDAKILGLCVGALIGARLVSSRTPAK